MTTRDRSVGQVDSSRAPAPRWGSFVAAAYLLACGLAIAPSVRAAKDDPPTSVLYVTSNNFNPGQNSVLAYRRDQADGSLTLIGSSLTRGTGVYNADERLGPDDSDQELIASPDHRFLFAVNSGSNTIAVFRTHSDGSLTHVNGSPFPSGGVQPVSLGLAGNKLYVVNKGDGEPGAPGNSQPNYTGFHVSGSGHLSPIPHSTVEINPGGSHPTQALISPDGRHLFGSDVFRFPFSLPPGFPPFVPPFASALESFRILPNGRLAQAPGTPQVAPPAAGAPFILGLQVHPSQPLLYTGFVLGGQLGTYRYDAAGALTFLHAAPNSGFAICWIAVDRQGTYAYTSNSATDSLSAYSLADPAAPVEIQHLELNGPKAPLPGPGATFFTTTPFQLTLEPSGRFLYVVNHETTLDDSFPDGNALHILQVDPANGMLTETADSPVILPVPAGAHPKGVVAF